MSLSASVLRVALVASAAALSFQVKLEDCKLPAGSQIREPNAEGFKDGEGQAGVKSFYEYETKLYGPENAVVQNTQDTCVPEACYWSPKVTGQLVMISDGSASFFTDFKCWDGSEFFATRSLSKEEAQNVKEITITSTSGVPPLFKGEVPGDVEGDVNSEVSLVKQPCELGAGAKVSYAAGSSAVALKGAGVMHPLDNQCVPEDCYRSEPGMTADGFGSSTTYWDCDNDMEFQLTTYWQDAEPEIVRPEVAVRNVSSKLAMRGGRA